MNRTLSILAVTLLCICVGRAGDTNQILGAWTGEPTLGQLGVTRTTYEFRTNSVFSRSIEYVTMSAMATMRKPPVTIPPGQMTGTYWVETNDLYLVFQGFEWMTNIATFVFQEDMLVLTQRGTTARFKRKK